MTRSLQVFVVGLALIAASQVYAQGGKGFKADLIGQLSYVEKQVLDLENAIPDNKMTWRPTKEVRSISEVYNHIAWGNYFMLSFAGVKPPTGLAITGPQDETAWDTATKDKAAIKDRLVASFDFTKKAIGDIPDSQLENMVDFFGTTMSVRGVLLVLQGHAHEHLGQSIAYARSVGVVPPWTAAQMAATKAKK